MLACHFFEVYSAHMAEQIHLRNPTAPLTSEELAFLFTNPPDSVAHESIEHRPKLPDMLPSAQAAYTDKLFTVTLGKIILSRQLLVSGYRDDTAIPKEFTDIAQELSAEAATDEQKAWRKETEWDIAIWLNAMSAEERADTMRVPDRGIFNPYDSHPVLDVLIAEGKGELGSYKNVRERRFFNMALENAGINHPDGPITQDEQNYMLLLFEKFDNDGWNGFGNFLPCFPVPVLKYCVDGGAFPYQIAPRDFTFDTPNS